MDETELHEPEPGEVRVAMLGTAPRGYTPVRHIAVQKYEADPTPGARASTIALMLRERKHRSLVLYLLLLAAWNRLENNDEPYGAHAWVRALSSAQRGSLTWSPTTLSRTWGDLQGRGLIVRKREERLVRVTPRREDGLADYGKPDGSNTPSELYFALPDAFWHEEWFARLRLPALVVLLVIAKETNGQHEVHLTLKQFENWYGISRKSAEAGLKQLAEVGLLHQRDERVKAPLSKTGWTTRAWYSLTGDFGFEARKAAQARAQAAVRARQGSGRSGASKPKRPRKPKKRMAPELPPTA